MGSVVEAAATASGLGNSDLVQTIGGSLGLGPNAKPNVSGYAPSAGENAFTQALMARYNGTGGPSPAQLQMQQGLGVANQNANAQAAAARGVSPALAAKMASDQQAGNQRSVLQNSGILGAQESLASGNTLAGLYGSQRQSAGAADQLGASVQQAQGDRLIKGVGMGLQGAGMMAHGGEVSGELIKFGDGGGDSGSPIMAMLKSKSAGAPAMARGGKVPIVVSPGEKILSPAESSRVAQGDKGPLSKKDIPGKAKVDGDSLENDNVPVKAEAGSTVIPRTANEDKDKAQEFVAKLKGKDSARPKSYGEMLSKHRQLEERVKELEGKLKKK